MQGVRQGDGRARTGARLLACVLAVLVVGAPLAGTAIGSSRVIPEESPATASSRPTQAQLDVTPASPHPQARATTLSDGPREQDPTPVPAPPTDTVVPRAPVPAPPSPAPAAQRWYTDRDLETLARLVHAESEGEPFAGRVAVAAIVLNRVRHQGFPGSISEVVFQPGAFEPVANGRIWEEPDRLSRQAAQAALDGWDPTGGALFFWNPAKVDRGSWIWQVNVTGQIGNHVFGWR